jgi:hypothetical protein
MLERNAERLLGDADVTLVQAGVSAWPGSATFEFDPNWTTLAGAGPFLRASEALGRSSRRRVGLVAWNRAAVDYGRRIGVIPTSTARRLNAALGNPVLAPLTCAAMWARFAGAKANALRRRQRIECELTTISAAMRDHGVEGVDLLKIDAEGAEWAVLQGIEASDWPRIRQFAIEVHDVEGRVDRIRALLEHKGYEVVVEHSDWELLELLGLRMVYARR